MMIVVSMTFVGIMCRMIIDINRGIILILTHNKNIIIYLQNYFITTVCATIVSFLTDVESFLVESSLESASAAASALTD